MSQPSGGSPTCKGGQCGSTCPAGSIDCGGTCTNITDNDEHCGKCNNKCPQGTHLCKNSQCIAGCKDSTACNNDSY